ncbi:sporulation integral membrane protein YtvI [Salipaludibacillus sp. HK11]|uniref:sporulation integral membrane protein YtvI n=1 Tax=Salipaludibacillus sp. HK11 TaxID=3394320 RepID=UPI0039FD9EDB
MKMNHSSTTWQQVLLLSLIILAVIFFSIVSFVYFYPFILAFLFSLMFLPFVNFLENHWNWNRTLATLFTCGTFVILLLTLVTFIIAELVQGLSYLVRVLPNYIDDILYNFQILLDNTFFPFINNITNYTSGLDHESNLNIDQTIDQLLSQVGTQLIHWLQLVLNQLRDFLMGIPHAMTMIFFSLLASFFITKDWPLIMYWFNKYIPVRLFQLVSRIITEWKSALGNYLKAQLTLVCITGVIVFIGLLILQVDYAFTAALLIAAVDILPYLGTGAIFMPWIIYSIFNSNWFMTIGLAVLYSVVVLQRQISEPRIVAHHIGAPTIVLLFTIFACYQFFGFIGVLFGPLILILTQSFARAGIVDEIKAFLK